MHILTVFIGSEFISDFDPRRYLNKILDHFAEDEENSEAVAKARQIQDRINTKRLGKINLETERGKTKLLNELDKLKNKENCKRCQFLDGVDIDLREEWFDKNNKKELNNDD